MLHILETLWDTKADIILHHTPTVLHIHQERHIDNHLLHNLMVLQGIQATALARLAEALITQHQDKMSIILHQTSTIQVTIRLH